MSRKIKKSVSILLALVMLCGVLAVAPVAVSAEEEVTVVATGTNSAGGIYTLDSNGVLHLCAHKENDDESGTGKFTGYTWNNITKTDVLSVTADEGVKFIGNCGSMFNSFSACTSMDLRNVNTSSVTSMLKMFYYCVELKTILLSDNFNTTAVTNMVSMFTNCKKLTSLDLSSFKINTTNIAEMFYNCDELKEITISDKFTGGITGGMRLNNGRTGDPGWVTSDSTTGKIVSGTGNYAVITDTKYLPENDEKKTYVWIPSEYEFIPETGKLHLISGFFRNTTWKGDFDKTEVKSVTANDKVVFTGSCASMFIDFTACTSMDLSNVDTSNVTSMLKMFYNCVELKTILLSDNFNTAAVTNMISMFSNCKELTSLDLSSFKINTTNIAEMFRNCDKLKEITISDKFTGGITSGMELNNGEDNNGWRIKGEPTAAKVSGDSNGAAITNPEYLPTQEGETKTYKWIGYFDVDWKNWDGTKLVKTETYKSEADIHPTYKGTTPTKTDAEGTAYTLAGWTDDLGVEYGVNDVLPVVTRDTTYTARFEAPKTEYTLNYIYQGRSGGNNGGYIGDNGASDTKTYTVTLGLGASDLEASGMPKAKVLVDNAPVVNDPYKDCRWTFTDEYVEFDSENNIVTITAEQPERKYSVVFKNSNNETTDVFRVKLNDFVKKNDSFITAEETDGSGTKFAYWSVVQNNKEVARCFERKFNLRVTGDSVVTAQYGEAENLVTLSEAEISRQQFTENGTKKDLLYADFITAYMDKQEMKLSQKTGSEYKTGMIVQYSPDVKVAKENAPGATLSASDKIEFANGDLLSKENAKTIANGGTVGGKYSYLTAPIDNTKYNDKNRLNKSLVFTNTETARRLVLCAYYYVYNVKTDEIEMTAPVYFYLYDAGNAVNTES